MPLLKQMELTSLSRSFSKICTKQLNVQTFSHECKEKKQSFTKRNMNKSVQYVMNET